MYITVTDRFGSKEEQMRMSIILRARTKDDACSKAASLVNPAYTLVGHERWFDMDASAKIMSQTVFRLPEPIKGYSQELRVASWVK